MWLGSNFWVCSTDFLICFFWSCLLRTENILLKWFFRCLHFLSAFIVFKGTWVKVTERFPGPSAEKQTDIADIDVLISVKWEHTELTAISVQNVHDSNCDSVVREHIHWNADGLKNRVAAYILIPSQLEETRHFFFSGGNCLISISI